MPKEILLGRNLYFISGKREDYFPKLETLLHNDARFENAMFVLIMLRLI